MKRRLSTVALLVMVAMVGDVRPTAAEDCCGSDTRTLHVVEQPGVDAELSREEQDELLSTAKASAKAIAGGETNADYFRELEETALKLKSRYYNVRRQSLYTRLRSLPGIAEPAVEPIATPFAAFRSQYGAAVANAASLQSDATWQQNFAKWLAMPQDQPLRIWGGEPAQPGEFQDCVAVGSPTGFCCSGTLIGPNIVVTAAHCVDGGCTGRVYIGNTSSNPGAGKVVSVRESLIHPDYNRFTSKNDIAVLILDESVDVTPRRIATSDEIDQAYFVQLAGFGLTEFGTSGLKMKVQCVIATTGCCETEPQDKFGCHEGLEFVAGGNALDSCNGDSGGPAYVRVGDEWRLAGATSRATRNFTRPCGDGGIYTRVDRYVDWIQQVAAANGGVIPD
jgi:hypothetical protein